MKNTLLVTALICSCFMGFAQNQNLFLIVENSKVGYINESGHVAIEPTFINAYPFSEGLAAARIDGRYGYIDRSGQFVIDALYDYVTSFNEGLALVYIKGKPFYINTKGEKVIDKDFISGSIFRNKRAIVTTENNKVGVINEKGEWIVEPIYEHIQPFNDKGLAIANIKPGDYKSIKYTVIDRNGEIIIQSGKYEEIQDDRNGYFLTGNSDWSYIVDYNGKEIYSKKYSDHSWLESSFYCDLAKVVLYKGDGDKKSYSSDDTYKGFIDMKGKLVIKDRSYSSAYNFYDNRAFVENSRWQYIIIDTKGNKIPTEGIERVLNYRFENGLAFVEVKNKWGLIDTSGHFIIEPTYVGIHDAGVIEGGYFFYKDSYADNGKYGIAHIKKGTIKKPFMDDMDMNGFSNGLLKCVISDGLAYVNMKGEIVWQEKNGEVLPLGNLNIDCMNRGYFYASSYADESDLGGFGGSNNKSNEITAEIKSTENQLSVYVDIQKQEKFYDVSNGLGVYVLNASKEPVKFNAQDSRLYMKVQALDEDGKWKDIEYLPSSWCGNSYHVLTLNANTYWKFVMPVYEGDYKTHLRVELKYIDPMDDSPNRWEKKEITIYSNEFEGSINLAQFWRKKEYYPNGIMDPYND